jgi:hypothetical protein
MRKEYGQCVRTTVYWHDYVISRISELFKVCLCQNFEKNFHPPPFPSPLVVWREDGVFLDACFMRTSLWEGGRRCQEVAGREGVIIIFERWGWVLVFSLWGSSPPTFLIFFGLSQKWVTFFDFSLKLHCYIAYKLVFVRIIRVRKGGKS